MRSSIIVLNMNGGSMIIECLQSLLSQRPAPDEIIVVDNGSTDGSDDLVESQTPEVTLLRQGANTGFTGGNNRGFRHSSGDAVILVNNDCVAEPGWLASLLDSVAAPGVGAVSSSMRNIHDLSVMDSAGGNFDWLGFSWDTGKGLPASSFDSPMEVAFPCGGAVALRREALPFEDRIFNEDLFIYQEDVELGFQLHRRGWKVLYDPEAVIRHVHSATTGKGSFFKERLCNRNRLIVLRRNMDPALFRRFALPLLAWQMLWTAASLLRGRLTLFRALLAGTWEGMRAPVEYDAEGRPLREIFLEYAVFRPGRPWRVFQSWARRILSAS
jgi:hypothetical protein